MKHTFSWFNSLHRKAKTVIIVILVVAVLGIIGSNMPKTTTIVPAAVDNTPSALKVTTAAPVEETPPPQPTTLFSLTGRGNNQTAKFTTTGDWQINYTYDCSNAGGYGNFMYYIYNDDGSMNSNDTGANELGASSNATNHYYDAGTFYLQIVSECTWQIKVVG